MSKESTARLGAMACLVEHLPPKQLGAGSSPATSTNLFNHLAISAEHLLPQQVFLLMVVSRLPPKQQPNCTVSSGLHGNSQGFAQTHEKKHFYNMTASILVQGGHGIHAGGAARGDVGGQQSYNEDGHGH